LSRLSLHGKLSTRHPSPFTPHSILIPIKPLRIRRQHLEILELILVPHPAPVFGFTTLIPVMNISPPKVNCHLSQNGYQQPNQFTVYQSCEFSRFLLHFSRFSSILHRDNIFDLNEINRLTFFIPMSDLLNDQKVLLTSNSCSIRERLVDILSNSDLDFHDQGSHYSSHNFHSFPAKFPPQLPKAFKESFFFHRYFPIVEDEFYILKVNNMQRNSKSLMTL
jgi:hypothetical protein